MLSTKKIWSFSYNNTKHKRITFKLLITQTFGLVQGEVVHRQPEWRGRERTERSSAGKKRVGQIWRWVGFALKAIY
jgi:hypothetical protein